MSSTILPGLPDLFRAKTPEAAREILELPLEDLAPLTKVTKSANSGGMWGPRDGARLYCLGTDLYLVGGWAGTLYDTNWNADTSSTTNQVYKSTDLGETWTRVRSQDTTPDATHFTPRHWFAGFVHDGFMWMVNGDSGWPNNGPINSDVRKSSDGITWTKVNSVNPGYHGLVAPSAGVFDGDFYVFGGQTASTGAHGETNNIWKSTDEGVTWSDLGTLTPEPSARAFAGDLVEFNGYLWLIAGGIYDDVNGSRTYKNDVWKFDPVAVEWTEVLANGHDQFPALFWPSVFTHNGWLYVSRGYATTANYAKTHRSRDGVNWEETDWVLQASHADAVAVTPTGVAVAVGNWTLGGSPSNTVSPTYFFYSDTSSVTSVADYVNDRIEAEAPTEYVFNPSGNILELRVGGVSGTFCDQLKIGDYMLADDGQCLAGQDGSNYYFASGFVSNSKVIRIGGSTNPLNLLDGLRLSNSSGSWVFNTSNLDRTTIGVTGTFQHNCGTSGYMGAIYSANSTAYFKFGTTINTGVFYFTLAENPTDGSTPFVIAKFGSAHGSRPNEIEIMNYESAPLILGTANQQHIKLNSSTGNVVEMLKGLRVPSMTDASAQNNTIYYSTTASKLVYKDSGGVVNNLY